VFCNSSAALGCGGIAWNVTAGLFDVFGARFVLNIWFPQPQDGPRYLLLPSGTSANSSAAAAIIAQQQQQQQQRIVLLEGVEGILLLSYRRFFSSINARDDYSFLETPAVPSSSSSSSSGKPIVRRQREANPQLPAYWSGRLAWGSPPVAKKVRQASGACCWSVCFGLFCAAVCCGDCVLPGRVSIPNMCMCIAWGNLTVVMSSNFCM
jgi:hypothetical protein